MKRIFFTVVFVICILPIASHGALFNIGGGTPIVTGAAGSGVNDVLGSGIPIQDNATLSWNTNNHLENDTIPGLAGATFLFGGPQAAAGLVQMSFTSADSGWGGGALKPGEGDTAKSLAFAYLTAEGIVTTTPTDMVLFALDNSGAGPDENHDDHVGFVAATIVPASASAWLFSSGVVALILVKRRKIKLH